MVSILESRTGYFTLNWRDKHEKEGLQEDCFYKVIDSEGFIFYQGKSSSSFISGKGDGNYNFSVTLECLNSSIIKVDEFSVNVNHYSRNTAFSFFGLGLLSFMILCLVILKESLKNR